MPWSTSSRLAMGWSLSSWGVWSSEVQFHHLHTSLHPLNEWQVNSPSDWSPPSQVHTASSERWRPSQRAWRKTMRAAAASRVTCPTCCRAMRPSTCAGWPGRWWPPSTCWRVTASARTMPPRCYKCMISESYSSPTTWRCVWFVSVRVCAFYRSSSASF